MEWITEFSTQLGFAGIFSLSVLGLMFKFLSNRNGSRNGGSKEDRKPDGGLSVIQYLQTEIKPAINKLEDKHVELTKTVASLPNRTEIQGKLEEIHRRINTKQDKHPPQGEF